MSVAGGGKADGARLGDVETVDLLEFAADADVFNRRLRATAQLVSGATVLNLFAVAGSAIAIGTLDSEFVYYNNLRLLALLPAAVTAFALLSVLRFDSLRKRSSVFIEELNDSLQFLSVVSPASRASRAEPESARLQRELRFSLRSALEARNLSLVPGQYGPAIYAAVNFVLLIIGLLTVLTI